MDVEHINLALALQQRPAHLRCVCICAHIDHGKTTIMDSLLASNQLISSENSGTLRHMDFLASEQERNITMKAAAVSLLHITRDPCISTHFDNAPQVPLLLTVIDTPGHCDFATEVMAAAVVCDGAILVVDLVEGVSSQTVTVIKAILRLRLQSVLVLNKLDRLHGELRLTPFEAFLHITRVLQDVNETYRTVLSELLETGQLVRGPQDEALDAEQYSPLHDNVIFSAALHNWGFTLRDFAVHLGRQFPFIDELDMDAVLYALWDSSTSVDLVKQRFVTMDAMGAPAFATLVLESLWAVLGCAALPPDKALRKVRRMYRKCLNKDLTEERPGVQTPEGAIRIFLADWLPLSNSIFTAIILSVSPPSSTQNAICVSAQGAGSLLGSNPTMLICGKILNSAEFTVIHLNGTHSKRLDESQGGHFVLCRVLSGVPKVGQRFTTLRSEGAVVQAQETSIGGFFCPMGQNIIAYPSDAAPTPGSICVVQFDSLISFCSILIDTTTLEAAKVEKPISKNMEHWKALSRSMDAHRLMNIPVPLITTAVIPGGIEMYPRVMSALTELCTIDTGTRYHVNPDGDLILATSGDVHLSRCCEQLDAILERLYPGSDTSYVVTDVALHVREHVIPGTCIQATDYLTRPDNLEALITEYLASLANRDADAIVALSTDSEAWSFEEESNDETEEEEKKEEHLDTKISQTCVLDASKTCTSNGPDPPDISPDIPAELTHLFEQLDKELARNSSQSSDQGLLQSVHAYSSQIPPFPNDPALEYYFHVCGSKIYATFCGSAEGVLFGHPAGLELLFLRVQGGVVHLDVHEIGLICTSNRALTELPEDRRIDLRLVMRDEDVPEYPSSLYLTADSIDDEAFGHVISTVFQKLLRIGPLCEEPLIDAAIIAKHVISQQVVMTPLEFETFRETELVMRSSLLPGFPITHPATSYVSNLLLFTRLAHLAALGSNIRIAEPYLQAIIRAPQGRPLQGTLTRLRCVNLEVMHSAGRDVEYITYVPVVNSSRLQAELREDCSGQATISYVSRTYVILDDDPRHVDVAADEDEEVEWGSQGRFRREGTKATSGGKMKAGETRDEDSSRILLRSEGIVCTHSARFIVEAIQRAKGLLLMQGVVVDAEKQRTMKRNK
ncbi:Elongation factor 2 [Giardia muris]|uniref:Elongation factor 2 n=1 Tax=Giardia muris TaxID=5742 RepID=A0A4Z1ST01_GIAMU|nr:Elongation factor 2 [Giardia muris]|eukprot:TNJ26778.1 Elongation factor 2 [Giardia muris]